LFSFSDLSFNCSGTFPSNFNIFYSLLYSEETNQREKAFAHRSWLAGIAFFPPMAAFKVFHLTFAQLEGVQTAPVIA